jgi:SulP family sulfate permease
MNQLYAVVVALISLYYYFDDQKYPKIPGPIVVVTFSVSRMAIPVDTIESRFGAIPSMLPTPTFPRLLCKNTPFVPRCDNDCRLAAIESLLLLL